MRYTIRVVLMGCLCFTPTLWAVDSTENELSLGLATPAPTGLSGKYWTTRNKAYQVFAGWNIADKLVKLHIDYLTHDYNQFYIEDSDTPMYWGFGARLVEEEDEDTITSLRFPIGVSYLPRSTPFDLFAEAAARMDLSPSTNFGLDLQIGVRYRIGR